MEKFVGGGIVPRAGVVEITLFGLLLLFAGEIELDVLAPIARDQLVAKTAECAGQNLTYFQLESLAKQPEFKNVSECYEKATEQVEAVGLGRWGWRNIGGQVTRGVGILMTIAPHLPIL